MFLYILIFLLLILIAVWYKNKRQNCCVLQKLVARAKLKPYHVSDDMVGDHTSILTLGRAIDPDFVLPEYFKWKERLMVPIRDQGKCASCWAFAVSDCLADRVSVVTGGKQRELLSVQELMSCFNPMMFHCKSGGVPEIAYQYVIHYGLCTEEDYPYQTMKGGKTPECEVDIPLLDYFWTRSNRHELHPTKIFGKQGTNINLCRNLSTFSKDSQEYKSRLEQNIRNMKTEIFLHGPIVGTVMVKKDLYKYNGESIYQSDPSLRTLGGHAIEIFGWCNDGVNTEEAGFSNAYWICRNSWGRKWPLHLPNNYGWFYMKMGINECGIEGRASAVQPLLTQTMKLYQSQTKRENNFYSSYNQYVADPERVNFFSKLKERRMSRSLEQK